MRTKRGNIDVTGYGRMLSLIYLIFIFFVKGVDGFWLIVLVSPDGTDGLDCVYLRTSAFSSSYRACKTIDYALQKSPSATINLVNVDRQGKQVVYDINLEVLTQKRSIFIRARDHRHSIHPVIRGRNMSWPRQVSLTDNVSLGILAVNLIDSNLLFVGHTRVTIKNSNMYNSSISIRNTVSLSTWLKSPLSSSSVDIDGSIINGVRFKLNNVDNVKFKNCTIKGNKELSNVMEIIKSKMIVENCLFTENIVRRNEQNFERPASLIYARKSTVKIYASTFRGNDVYTFFEFEKICDLVISDSLFHDNKAHVCIQSTPFTPMSITRSRFTENTASVMMVAGGKTYLRNTGFENNTSFGSLIRSAVYLFMYNISIKHNKLQDDAVVLKTSPKASPFGHHNLLTKIIFVGNLVGGNIINVLGGSTAILGNMLIQNNKYKACIYGTESVTVNVSNMIVKDNEAISLVKLFRSRLVLKNIFANSNESVDPVIDILETHLSSKNVTLTIAPTLANFILVIRILQHLYGRNDIRVQCPNTYKSYSSKTSEQYQQFCEPCERGMYKMSNVEFAVNNSISNLPTVETNNKSASCKRCPFGGNCNHQEIRSSDHFYGFLQGDSSVEFLPCPVNYCCSNKGLPCTSMTTCNKHRTGRLCGRCQEGYYINYFTNDCIPSWKCTAHQQKLFWFINISNIVVLALLLIFARDIKEGLKELIINLKEFFSLKLKKKKSKITTELPSSQSKSNTKIKEIPSVNELPTFTYSGVFNILVTFYQLKTLVTISSTEQSNVSFIDNIFNTEIIANRIESYCPSISLTVISRELIKSYFTPILMLLTVVVCYGLVNIKRSLKKLCCTGRGEQHYERFFVGCYVILAFSYKNICRLAFSFVHCKTMEGVTFLYISGDTVCYSRWQIANFVFLFVWVAPFPLAVGFACNLLKRKRIASWGFTFCLLVPIAAPVMPVYCTIKKPKRKICWLETDLNFRLEEIFEEPYKKTFAWWECWILYERLIVTGMSVFLINPIFKVIYMTPVLIFFHYLHCILKPYKESMTTLYRLDMVSHFCICVHLVINSFRSLSYVYSLGSEDLVSKVSMVTEYFELVFSPLWYLVVFMLVSKVYNKVKSE